MAAIANPANVSSLANSFEPGTVTAYSTKQAEVVSGLARLGCHQLRETHLDAGPCPLQRQTHTR